MEMNQNEMSQVYNNGAGVAMPQQVEYQPQPVNMMQEQPQPQPMYQPQPVSAVPQPVSAMAQPQVAPIQPVQNNAQAIHLEDGEYELPVGYVDGDGVLHKTIKLRPMTGETEEAVADPKVRDNGGKLITELIFSVTDSIGTLRRVNKDVIRGLAVADRDYILLRNRQYSIGDEVEYTDTCPNPNCKCKNQVHVNLNDIPVDYFTPEDSRELTFDLANGIMNANKQICKKITIRMPIGTVSERIAPIARVNPAQATTAMIHLITKKIEGVDFLNPEVFKKMTKKDRDLISKKLVEFKAGVELNTTVQCAGCGEEFKSQIPLQSLMGE